MGCKDTAIGSGITVMSGTSLLSERRSDAGILMIGGKSGAQLGTRQRRAYILVLAKASGSLWQLRHATAEVPFLVLMHILPPLAHIVPLLSMLCCFAFRDATNYSCHRPSTQTTNTAQHTLPQVCRGLLVLYMYTMRSLFSMKHGLTSCERSSWQASLLDEDTGVTW